MKTLADVLMQIFKPVMRGRRAFTTQNYTEINVKSGVQFSVSTYLTDMIAGEVIDVIVITGSKPVAIKAQHLAVKNGGDVIADWYKSPTYSGGANLSAGIFNQTDISPQPTTVQLIGVAPTNPAIGNYSPNDATKPVVTNVGTKIAPTLVALGSSGPGSNHASRDVTLGLEHILAPNTTYLYRRVIVEPLESMFGFSTWYEGVLDAPFKEITG